MAGKFQYAPGLVSYGAQGQTGQSGSTGLSMYISSLNGITNLSTIITDINNNTTLLIPSTPLPGGRSYTIGDIFIDSVFSFYEITAVSPSPAITSLGITISNTAFFNQYSLPTNEGYTRFLNKVPTQSPGASQLVDIVYSITGSTINYAGGAPNLIYDISSLDFGQIFYSGIKIAPANFVNPYTVWIGNDDTAGAAT